MKPVQQGQFIDLLMESVAHRVEEQTQIISNSHNEFLYKLNGSQNNPNKITNKNVLNITYNQQRQSRDILGEIKRATDGKRLRLAQYKNIVSGIYFSNRTTIVNDFKFVYLREEPFACRNADLIIMVNTRPSAGQSRSAIRDTWGMAARNGSWLDRYLPYKVALVFVVGLSLDPVTKNKLANESSFYHDIIQGDFIDHYHNLTLKSLLAMHWAARHCHRASYFLKSDDDMVLNIPALWEAMKDTKRAIMGPHFMHSEVRRTGKWAVREQDLPLVMYPPFAVGSAYILTTDLLGPLVEASEYFRYFHVDDAFITGILAKHVRANHLVSPGFSYERTPKPTPCDFHNNTRYTGHGFDASGIRVFWNQLRSFICSWYKWPIRKWPFRLYDVRSRACIKVYPMAITYV